MSPKVKSNISDHESDSLRPQRGRPPVPPSLVLEAAARLFANAGSHEDVTMDTIAAEAGVGKGSVLSGRLHDWSGAGLVG
jgi:Bacterial regulatory proteins, tetR family